jgi:hypothetical protein
MKFLDNWTINLSKIPSYNKLIGKEFTQQIDKELLLLILEKITDNKQKAMIHTILSKLVDNTLTTSYYQNMGLGRLQLKDNVGLLPLKRCIKNTLFSYSKYIDIDQVKGHVTILVELCKRNNYSIAIYEQYLEHFDDIVKEFQEMYNSMLTKKEVKHLFNITIYGGSIHTWFKEMENEGWKFLTKEVNDFYADFKLDTDKLMGVILSHNKELTKRVFDPKKTSYENDNRAVSYYCQIIENEINYQAFSYLKEHKLIHKNFDWGMDGITFPKGEFNIDELNAYVRNKTNFTTIKYVEKELDKTFDDLIEVRKNMTILTEKEKLKLEKDKLKLEKEREKERLQEEKEKKKQEDHAINLEKEQIKLEKAKMKLEKDKQQLKGYAEKEERDEFAMKELNRMISEFEKNHLKIVNKSCFIKHNNEGYIIMSEQQLITAYKDMWYGYDDNGNRLNFITRWLNNNDTQRKKIDIGCFPDESKCPDSIFNTWIPFAMSFITEYEHKENELQIILNHIRILCGNHEETYNHFILWIAQMLQYPAIKTCCPFFISEKGAGKGTLMSLLQKMIGVKKYKETTNPSIHVWGNFNEDMANCFLVNLDELSKKELLASEEKFKGLVTNPILPINGKNQRPYDIVSYHRFIVTTNGKDYLPDRRCWIIRSSDEKIPDKQYFEELRNMIDNVDVVKTCYEYFMKVEGADKFNKIPIPETEFQQDLKEANRPIVEQWLYDYVLENNDKLEITLSCKEVLDKFCSWRDRNKITFEINSIKLGLKIKQMKLNGITKGQHTRYGEQKIFNIPILKKHFGIGCLIDNKIISDNIVIGIQNDKDDEDN